MKTLKDSIKSIFLSMGYMGSNIANTLIMVIYNYIPKSVFLVLCIASIIVMIAVVTLFIIEFRKMDKLCNLSKIWYNRSRFAKHLNSCEAGMAQ